MKVYSTFSFPQDVFFSADLTTKMLNEYTAQLPLITQFCREKSVRVSCIDATDEKGYDELMCFFDDDCGGYTIQGIKNSLEATIP